MTIPNGTVTLIGSGEFSEAMGRVYRAILARAPLEPLAVFLDTPAGFEVNADAISAKAADYFSQRLGLQLGIASFKNKFRATALGLETALYSLRRADFIFAGPGSPSYAVRNWKHTPVWDTLLNRFQNGAHLIFASAAAIAVSASALPVYEIYKAGADPHWLDGLNLFAALGMNLAIVPHWNNAEGGTYDTRFCFMGEPRFRELERLLPGDTIVLGVDESTACVFDLSAQTCHVMGAGNVTLRWNEREWVYRANDTFSFTRLRAGAWNETNLVADFHAGNESADGIARSLLELGRALDMTDEPQAQRALIAQAHATIHQFEGDDAISANAADATTRYLMELARALDETRAPDEKRALIDHAHDTMHELAANWMDDAPTAKRDDLAPCVETLIYARQQLRAAKQYALADEIRERLAALGIVLEDSSTGTIWRRAEP